MNLYEITITRVQPALFKLNINYPVRVVHDVATYRRVFM